MKAGSTVMVVSTGGMVACVGLLVDSKDSSRIVLERASVVRRPQRHVMTLRNGPDARAIMEFVGYVEFPTATVAALYECDAAAWAKVITGGVA